MINQTLIRLIVDLDHTTVTLERPAEVIFTLPKRDRLHGFQIIDDDRQISLSGGELIADQAPASIGKPVAFSTWMLLVTSFLEKR